MLNQQLKIMGQWPFLSLLIKMHDAGNLKKKKHENRKGKTYVVTWKRTTKIKRIIPIAIAPL